MLEALGMLEKKSILKMKILYAVLKNLSKVCKKSLKMIYENKSISIYSQKLKYF